MLSAQLVAQAAQRRKDIEKQQEKKKQKKERGSGKVRALVKALTGGLQKKKDAQGKKKSRRGGDPGSRVQGHERRDRGGENELILQSPGAAISSGQRSA